jgi:hypothetical protein
MVETATMTVDDDVAGGSVSHFWAVAPGDPEGPYALGVSLAYVRQIPILCSPS